MCLIWNAQVGYLICRLVLKDKTHSLSEKKVMLMILILLFCIGNLMFIKQPIQTHIAHWLIFVWIYICVTVCIIETI